MKKYIKQIKKSFKKLQKKINRKVNEVRNAINWKIAISKRTTILFTLHPFVGFRFKNKSGVKELVAGVATITLWSFDSAPRVHGFKIDSTYVTVSKVMRKIPTAVTFSLTTSPLWLIWDIYNYRVVKNIQNNNAVFTMVNHLSDECGEPNRKILKKKSDRPRKLTKFEKSILSGQTKVVTDINGKVVKVITKGKKK